LEEEVRHNLDRYAEFIGANASYVVSEALKLLFKRDDEFKRWLSEHPTNINQESNQRRRSYKDRVTDMKPRPTQFAMRENTASSRQHAPRYESSEESSINSPNDDARTTVTEAGREEGNLLTVHEVATMLQVPVSWVYGRMRKRSVERLPGYRLGKYWRFSQAEVLAWIESQRRNSHVA
jgi:excisionase family DNA binding protein